MFERIPADIRAFPQWVVWRYEEAVNGKPTKVPYSALTGLHASVNDPATWSSFAQALKVSTAFSGIGFVLTESDPYGFIDLDNPTGARDPNEVLRIQHRIYTEFNSYSERSPSGSGLHIIIRGAIPEGHKRDKIEIYSSRRFMTMTGDIYNDVPIMERQQLFSLLCNEMARPARALLHVGNEPQTEEDNAVIERALAAQNGEKFRILLEGRWQELYSSQSEADYAFIDIIAFYTKNREQIARIFRATPLGARSKAKRLDYVNAMINNSFDRQLPPIDFDGLMHSLQVKLEELTTPQPSFQAANAPGPEAFADTQLSLPGIVPIKAPKPSHLNNAPPGLVGEIAEFIYNAAQHPVYEIALGAAIALVSGIAGRAYNTNTGTGLNQYLLVLADTGTGKEAAKSGISKLMGAVGQNIPAALSFIGPGQINSGQALVRFLSDNTPCFVSVVGEFGLMIRQLSAENASSSQVLLRKHILDLYNKSGFTDIFDPSVYSDKAKNTGIIRSPAMTILGESVPEEFYSTLDEGMIRGGFLPRFTILHYDGIRVDRNKHAGSVMPPLTLVERVGEVCVKALTLMQGQRVITVQLDTEADELSDMLDKYSTRQVNTTRQRIVKELWTRVHMKTLRLASVIAVGVNSWEPLVTKDIWNWAQSLIVHDCISMSQRFERGEIGKDSEESRQVIAVKDTIRSYYMNGYTEAAKFGSTPALWEARLIPYAYIQRKLVAMSAFRHDRIGATNAIKRTLAMMLESDTLRELARGDSIKKFNTHMRSFMVVDTTILEPN